MTERYFAYGSNLWIDQMVRRTGPLDRSDGWPRRAKLAGYRVAFNMRGEDGEVFANIVPATASVLGVVYRCGAEAMLIMDKFEEGYEQHRISVVTDDQQRLDVITYIAKPDHIATSGLPGPEYLRRIVRGARDHGIPEDYIHEIETQATVANLR
jgi:gamma-glutamylcyclotransferase